MQPVERLARAAHADELPCLQHVAVPRDVERPGAEDRVAVLPRVRDARASRLPSGFSFAVSLRNVSFGGSGGTIPSGGLSGVTSGIGIGIGTFVVGSWMKTTGSSFRSLSNVNERLLTLLCGPSSDDVQRVLRGADPDLRAPVRLARPGHRARVDVEDVADLVRERRDVAESVPWCRGMRSIGIGTSSSTLGITSGMTPSAAYFASATSTRTAGGIAGYGSPSSGMTSMIAVRSLPLTTSVETGPVSERTSWFVITPSIRTVVSPA